MPTTIKTKEFDKAFRSIGDKRARLKILARIDRLELGNPGDVKAVGDGISEMRIDYGPGYRLYYTQVGQDILLLLTCGNKDSQDRDIRIAKTLKEKYRNEGARDA